MMRTLRWVAEFFVTIAFATILWPSTSPGWVYINRWPGDRCS